VNSDNIEKIISLLISASKKLPSPAREIVSRELENIKEMLMDNRPPRVLIIGRRGAGKSSIVNALFKARVAEVGSVLSQTGKAKWHTFQNESGSIEILDTRGLGDRTKPESANFTNAVDDIKVEIKNVCPDVILFLCKAKEVDSHIRNDLQNLALVRQYISEVHSYEIPVAALVTQVDELDPKRIEPPYDNPEKMENINKAVKALQDAYGDSSIELLKIIPVSAYAEFKDDRIVYENYWNIDELIAFLMDHLPKSAQLQLARLTRLRKLQVRLCRKLIASTALICGGLAATPIPIGDIFPITAAQIGMIMGIGYIGGRELSKKTAKEFFAALGLNVGAGFALRELARAAGKIVFPGAGYVISAGIAVSATWGIGEAAIAYFIDRKSIKEAQEAMKHGKKEHEKESEAIASKLESVNQEES
jgi:predicted GTPase/uncharacterized protein (DUF697 family)